MTSYRALLRLNLEHECYGEAEIPIDIAPVDATAFAQTGLRLRRHRGGVEIFVPDSAAELPKVLDLSVLARSPKVMGITEGIDQRKQLCLPVPLGMRDANFADAVAQWDKPEPDNVMGQITVSMPDAGGRDLTLRFASVQVHWRYKVVGTVTKGGLSVEDPQGRVSFDNTGKTKLADGRDVVVFRSARPLPLGAAAPHRFALHHDGTTVISPLPAAGVDVRQVESGSGEDADIFVSLI